MKILKKPFRTTTWHKITIKDLQEVDRLTNQNELNAQLLIKYFLKTNYKVCFFFTTSAVVEIGSGSGYFICTRR